MEVSRAIDLIDDKMCWGRGTFSAHHMPERDEYWQAGEMAIEALKKQEEDRWVRCSERLPSNHGNYLIYTSDTESDYEEVDIGTFDELRGKWSACDAHGFYWLKDRGIEVIALRPIIVPNIEEIEDGSN